MKIFFLLIFLPYNTLCQFYEEFNQNLQLDLLKNDEFYSPNSNSKNFWNNQRSFYPQSNLNNLYENSYKNGYNYYSLYQQPKINLPVYQSEFPRINLNKHNIDEFRLKNLEYKKPILTKGFNLKSNKYSDFVNFDNFQLNKVNSRFPYPNQYVNLNKKFNLVQIDQPSIEYKFKNRINDLNKKQSPLNNQNSSTNKNFSRNQLKKQSASNNQDHYNNQTSSNDQNFSYNQNLLYNENLLSNENQSKNQKSPNDENLSNEKKFFDKQKLIEDKKYQNKTLDLKIQKTNSPRQILVKVVKIKKNPTNNLIDSNVTIFENPNFKSLIKSPLEIISVNSTDF